MKEHDRLNRFKGLDTDKMILDDDLVNIGEQALENKSTQPTTEIGSNPEPRYNSSIDLSVMDYS